MALMHVTLLLALATSALSYRPFYAGKRPVMDIARSSDDAGPGIREGGREMSTTAQPLPLEALGDRALFDRASRLPTDQQPFWLLNWKALEANRKNPQTYSQRPSHFGLQMNPSPNAEIVNSNSASTGLKTAGIASDTETTGFSSARTGLNFASTGLNSASASSGLPIPSIDFPNINPSSLFKSGNGGGSDINFGNSNSFANPGIGISNILPANSNDKRNPSIPLGIGNTNGFANPTNGEANPPNSFANPENGILNNAPGNKNENTNDFGNPANGFAKNVNVFAKSANGFANPASGISNAPGNKNENTNSRSQASIGNGGSTIISSTKTNGFVNGLTNPPVNEISHSVPDNANMNRNTNSPPDNENDGPTSSAKETFNSSPGNRNVAPKTSFPLGSRNEGPADRSSINANGFVNPEIGMKAPDNRKPNTSFHNNKNGGPTTMSKNYRNGFPYFAHGNRNEDSGEFYNNQFYAPFDSNEDSDDDKSVSHEHHHYWGYHG